jgi:hypothetical protein
MGLGNELFRVFADAFVYSPFAKQFASGIKMPGTTYFQIV